MSAGSGALRRRRKPSLATRLKIAWVFLILIVGGAGYGGYILVTLPQLRVHDITVTIDGSAVRERDVLSAAAIDRNRNIWLLDTARIARRIEAIPYVDRATIVRTPPARLSIVVTERRPVGCVHGGSHVVTIDRERRILQNGCVRAAAIELQLRDMETGRPGTFAVSPAVAALLGDGRVLEDAGIAARSIAYDAYGGIVVVDERGMRMLFGSDADLADKAKLVRPIIAATPAGRALRSIDLRAPATPTVEYR